MNKDDILVNYFFDERVRKRTFREEDIWQLYSWKYNNWIVPFLNKHSIEKVPMILCCNTLYQIPGFFSIGDKNFFVADYNLYLFLYDMNFTSVKPELDEYKANIYIKTYIEQAYLKGRINFCDSACATSLEIEEYKKLDFYQDEKTINHLSYLTDIQEKFIFLHEASHFLYSKYTDDIKESSGFNTIKECLSEVINETEFYFDDGFYEECYCDYKSAYYTLESTYSDIRINFDEYISLFFKTIINIYIIQFFAKCQDDTFTSDNELEEKDIKTLSLRLANLYKSIYDFLILNGKDSEPLRLEGIYKSCVEEFSVICSDIRLLKSSIEKNVRNIGDLEDFSYNEKIAYKKDYLLLI
jgi:hypothetical protein